MRDFYATSMPVPLDQADGLRRLFAGPRRRVLVIAANPHVAASGALLDRVATVLAEAGRSVLVADAGPGAPAPSELARLDLAAGIEPVAPRVGYLPARGLPLAHVDTRGSAGGFVDALLAAAPGADTLVVHAEAPELARMLMRRSARPLLLAADHPESLKHAYAAAKLIVQRTGLATFDLLLAAATDSPRAARIADSLARTAEQFLGALLHDWALIDPSRPDDEDAADRLAAVLSAQLALDTTADEAIDSRLPPGPRPAAAGSRTRLSA